MHFFSSILALGLLHVKEGYFFTPPEWVTSPIWGPPPSWKQALSRLRSENVLSFENVLFSTIRLN